jgi:hypothetical protein
MRNLIFALALVSGCTENNYYVATSDVQDAQSSDANVGDGGISSEHDAHAYRAADGSQTSDAGQPQAAQGSVDATADAQVVAPAGRYVVTITLESTPDCIPSYDEGAEVWTITGDTQLAVDVRRTATQGDNTFYTGTYDGALATLYDYRHIEMSGISFSENGLSGFGRRPGVDMLAGVSCKVNIKIEGVKQ